MMALPTQESPKIHHLSDDMSPTRTHHGYAPVPYSRHAPSTLLQTTYALLTPTDSKKTSSHLRNTRTRLGLHFSVIVFIHIQYRLEVIKY